MKTSKTDILCQRIRDFLYQNNPILSNSTLSALVTYKTPVAFFRLLSTDNLF